MIPGIHISDVSEFQGHPGWSDYARARQAAICRIGYGDAYEDLDWAFDAAGVRTLPWRGFYHYMVSGQDAGAQARQAIAWIDSVGGLKPGDSLWLDVEEGNGDLRGVVNTYFSIVDSHFSITTGLYSYGNFFDLHLGGATGWGNRPIWLAAYQNNEPAGVHALWQHTNGVNGDIACQPAPGLGPCDCSVSHLTLDQLLALPCTVQGAKPSTGGFFMTLPTGCADDGAIGAEIRKTFNDVSLNAMTGDELGLFKYMFALPVNQNFYGVAGYNRNPEVLYFSIVDYIKAHKAGGLKPNYQNAV